MDKLFNDKPLSPAEHLRQKLDEIGQTNEWLASIIGCSRQQIQDLLFGRRGITAEMAVALGAALKTSASFWVKVDADYRLSQVKNNPAEVERRAKLYELAPIKEMQKRGWIKAVKATDELEKELREFFNVDSLETIPEFPLVLRKSDPLSDLTPLQRAWCFRAKKMAAALQVPVFDERKMDSLTRDLRILAAYPNEASRVPDVMRRYGIRYVIVEPLPGSKIDGAAFWLDESSPVIAMSLLRDRLDNFWFTLMHECAHIQNKDAISVDTDLDAQDRAPALMKANIERRADEQAESVLIPNNELDSFIRRIGPIYAKPNITRFAVRMKIHPDIVVGQLQHRGEIGFNRKMLAKIREHVVGIALTDGWDNEISPDTI